jgi:uncharacterized protein involved in exopolysaccharide biosynthesis
MSESNELMSDSAQSNFENRIEALVDKYRPFLVNLWADRWRLVSINGGVVTVSVLILLFLVRPYFDSSVVILPHTGRSNAGVLSQLSGLVSLSGLGNVNLTPGISPEVYKNLLHSESVLNPVFYTKYQTEKFATPVTLIEYFELEPDGSLPPALRERQLMLDFMEIFVASMMRVNIDRVSGIIAVTVRMPESKLSADVANAVASALNRYVVDKNRELARQSMEYIEARLIEVKDSLMDAEEELKSFREKNRLIATSPELALEERRLSRAVDLKQAVYVELERQYEIARIEQQKETPIVNFREEAREPVKKTGPRRTVILMIIMLVSGTVTSLWSYFNSSVRRIFASLRGR